MFYAFLLVLWNQNKLIYILNEINVERIAFLLTVSCVDYEQKVFLYLC